MHRPLRYIQLVFAITILVLAVGASVAFAGGPEPDSAPSAPAPSPDAARPLFPPNFTAPTQRPSNPGLDNNAPQRIGSGGVGGISAMLVPLAVVVGVILLAAIILKKVVTRGGSLASMLGAAGRAPSGILEILGRYPISRSQTFILLKIDQRILLVAQTHPTRHHPGAFTTLTELADPSDVASILMKISETEQTGPASKFNNLLREFDAETDRQANPIRRGLRSVIARAKPGPVSWHEPGSPVAEIELPTNAPTDLRSLRSQLQSMRAGKGAA